MQGEVKWFNADRHFGFITSNGKDFFFHGSCFEGDPTLLRGGERVSFRLGDDERSGRERAEEVKLIRE